VIVLDASTLVSAAMKPRSVPGRAVNRAFEADEIAVSEATLAELADVLARPRLARFVSQERREELLALLDASGVFFAPTERVADCRDAKDDKYLELALASAARIIVSSDTDLIALHPWRGVKILRPGEYLAEIGDGDRSG
jgi:putative PIN family toxin of toxin-antitoxin system